MKWNAALARAARSIRILSWAFVLWTAVSCASTSGSSPAQREALFQKLPTTLRKGVSTQPDVTALLGAPDRKRISPEGETWIYGPLRDEETFGEVVADQVVGVGVGFIPVPYAGTAFSLFRSAASSKHKVRSEPAAAVLFDHQGRVKDYVVHLPSS